VDKLREYISYFFDLTDSEWEEFTALMKPAFYSKGTIIYDCTENEKGLCFIVGGSVRSYKLREDGKDFTWGFYCLNNDSIEHRMLINVCMVDYVSFVKNEPSDLTFEVLLDTTLMCIARDDLDNLFNSTVRWQKFARVMAENAYCSTQHRAMSLLTKSAQERLSELEEYFPAVFERKIMLDHVASYLGITRQSLNRLRREGKS